MVQFISILHTVLRKQWQKVNLILESQQTPHISPSLASYGVSFVRIWGKIDCNVQGRMCSTCINLKPIWIPDVKTPKDTGTTSASCAISCLPPTHGCYSPWEYAWQSAFCVIIQTNFEIFDIAECKSRSFINIHNSQKTYHTFPVRVSHGVSFVGILVKIDHAMMWPDCRVQSKQYTVSNTMTADDLAPNITNSHGIDYIW